MKSLISVTQLTRQDIEHLIEQADKFANGLRIPQFNHKIIGLLFFEASTRTQLGFEAAAYKLGAKVLKLNEAKFNEKMSKSESIEDTLKVIESYADLICLRYQDNKIMLWIDNNMKKTIINAGIGNNEHPTQCLIDLFTIKKLFGKIDGLKIGLIGNLKDSRTAHSLVLGLSNYKNIELEGFSPKELSLQTKYIQEFLKSRNNKFKKSEKMNVSKFDILYIAGFPPNTSMGRFKASERKLYQINAKKLELLKPSAKILCPLPRIDEIVTDIDNTKFASYFKQNELGLYMRMAILSEILRSS